MKKAKKNKYVKYRRMILPKILVDVLFLKLRTINSEKLNPVKLINIGISMFHEILSKSPIYKVDSNEDFIIPYYSKVLQQRYGKDYNKYLRLLSVSGLINRTLYYKEGECMNYSLLDFNNYKNKILLFENINRDNGITVDIYQDIISPYCYENNIEITPIPLTNKGIHDDLKNRNFITEWYELKIVIDKNNKKYLTKDFDEDAKNINNSNSHIKQMGSYYKKNLEIRYEDAMEFTLNNFVNEQNNASNDKDINRAYNRFVSRIISLQALDNGDNKSLRFRRNKTNARLDTNLTNLASELRQFIVGYEDMAYLDLSNSQPVFFNIMLNKHLESASESLKNEITRYRESTLSGTWYEELAEIYGITREEAKKRWMEIAYSKNKSYKNNKKRFKIVFPEISAIIEKYKENDHANFAIKLQKIESAVFIDKISKKLVDEGIIPFTIHDAILVGKENKEKALSIMKEILTNELGGCPLIKVE
jgi:hypothetical protein